MNQRERLAAITLRVNEVMNQYALEVATAFMQMEAKDAEIDALKREMNVMTHKVITCGVAATNPNPNLTRTPPYSDAWDSPQAESVRLLRSERDKLKAELAERNNVIEQLEAQVKVESEGYLKLRAKMDAACAGDLACGGICPRCAPFREEEINALKAKIDRLVAAGDALHGASENTNKRAAWTAAKESDR